jgi:3-(3-hydroxy-phenyl)propionate hydroxylase
MHQDINSETDVLIIGSGPTGMTLASFLGDYGISTTLIERNVGLVELPRAIVLDDEGARTMQAIGIMDTLSSEFVPSQGSRYLDEHGDSIAVTGSGSKEFGFEKRYFIDQPILEQFIAEGLQKKTSVKVHFSTSLLSIAQSEEGVFATVQCAEKGVHTIKAKYLVGCDGGRSTVRELLDIEMVGDTYGQDWVVIDVINDPNSELYSKFICDPNRPTVIVPAPHGERRYEFMLLPGETREEMLSDEKLALLLSPYRSYNKAEIKRAVIYTFHARIASHWKEGNVFLAGDAAHLTPPFAGQGMNAGLRDVHNLGWKLAAVLSNKAHPKLLESYEDERRDPCWAMICLAATMGEIIMPMTDSQKAAKDFLMHSIEKFPSVKDFFFSMKFKPKPRFTKGTFIEIDSSVVPGSLVGAMMPQPKIALSEGRHQLLDDLTGNQFVILVQDDSCEHAVKSLTHELWRILSPRVIRLNWDNSNSSSADITHVNVMEHEVVNDLRVHRDQILIVRPDRYIAGAVFPKDLATFEKEFLKFLKN